MEKKRVLYYDVLNILACLCVVAMHHNEALHSYDVNTGVWRSALAINVLCCWSVPVFLMLTGAKLLNYRSRYDTKTFLKKRMDKVLLPFLFWSIFLMLWKSSLGIYSVESMGISDWISAILNYDMEEIYWFFPTIIALYLGMPLLSPLSEEKHRSTLIYGILALFILHSVVPPLATLAGISWNSSFALEIGSHVIFILLGYLLATTELSRRSRLGIYAAGIFGMVFQYAAVCLLSTQSGTKNSLFLNNTYFPAVLSAAAVFVFIKQVDWQRLLDRLHIRPGLLVTLSSCSLGVYLIHKITMHYELIWLNSLGIYSYRLIWRVAFPLITYVVSVAVVLLLKRIPVLRRLVL